MLSPPAAHSFCGFYVASGDAKLFNHASQVVLVRSGDRTVLTMANDFKGEPSQFAIVVPVPVVLQRGQIHVGDPALLAHLEAYSAPRLVEYFDEDPCAVREREEFSMLRAPASKSLATDAAARNQSLGVKIEARYTVGEYDILILSAKQSTGLEIWLQENGYRIPAGASRVLASYIRQNMKFFVAKVNLKEKSRLGFASLRPLQMAFESPKFMLPIRLGMVNADGPQDLLVFALTPKGRVETTNYRTVKMVTDLDVPLYVKDRFADVYRAAFDHQVRVEGMESVFTEYFWNMSWCDPCASPPLDPRELGQLGVFWVDDPSAPRIGRRGGGGAQGVFLTRLHVRYDAAHFPEDLVFQETADQSQFQARYVLHHPWSGDSDCPAIGSYLQSLRQRHLTEAKNLASLTGWSEASVRATMRLAADGSSPDDAVRWWQRLWRD